MTIQGYPGELDYVNAKLNPSAPPAGAFLESFLMACLRADAENYEFLRPILKIFIEKYPAEPGRLGMERLDRGEATQADLDAIAEEQRKRRGI